MTKKERRKLKRMLRSIRWMMVRHRIKWCILDVLDAIITALAFILLIVTSAIGLIILLLMIILDVIVSIVSRTRHCEATRLYYRLTVKFTSYMKKQLEKDEQV